ncbi:hypothetical protein D5R40_29590 [Okeania hirsuta]|uniref:Uncharacterized protein n=1 Tax=Okeania hirsuta TaxID=1458930 RepID=A0A3N6R367_9CYAN|nr:hypothetical protein D5R40_29590 [Okeania hirsuta]
MRSTKKWSNKFFEAAFEKVEVRISQLALKNSRSIAAIEAERQQKQAVEQLRKSKESFLTGKN